MNDIKDFLDENPDIKIQILKDHIEDKNKKIDFLYYVICTLLGIMIIPKIVELFM